VVTVETNLPLRLLNSIQLNDALIIRDKKYRINLMKSQLTTGKVTLELITDIVTQPRTIPPTAPPLPVDGGDLVLPIKPIKGGYWTITPAAPYPYITTTPVILVKQTGEVNVKFNVAANGTGTDRTAYYSVNFYDAGDNLYKSEPYRNYTKRNGRIYTTGEQLAVVTRKRIKNKTMKHILELLKMSDWLAVSENVDIAKGKHKLETTIKGKIKQEKRRKAWQ
jgi:hypothetical protein